MRHVAAAIVVLLCTTLSGCVSCDCGRGLDAGTDSGEPAADADAGAPQCPEALLLWDGAWDPPTVPSVGLYPNEMLQGFFLLTGENIGSFGRFLQPGAEIDGWPRVQFPTVLDTARSFGDGTVLVLGFMAAIGPDGSDRLELYATRLSPLSLVWTARATPLDPPTTSNASWPTTLDDGSIAFSYRYLEAGMTSFENRRAIYDFDGLVADYDTAFDCSSPLLFDCADDGEGGGWRIVNDGGDPPQHTLQHFAVDGTPLLTEPGIDVFPPHELYERLALLRHPAGGGIHVSLYPLDPSDPSIDSDTVVRGTFVQRFDELGNILWETRVDDGNGPRGAARSLHTVGPSGEVLTAWYDLSDGPAWDQRHCYIRTIDGSGEPMADGIEMGGEYDAMCGFDAVGLSDEQGFMAIWEEDLEGPRSIVYAMRFDWSLVPQWPEPLRLNCPEEIGLQGVFSDGAGGGIASWIHDRNLYLVRVRADGTTGWYDE